MKLSERIEQADYDCETLWRYLEDAGHPPDGDAINTVKAVIQTLLDCERLAKRYEDAPVGFVMGQQGLLTEGKAAIVSMEDPAPVKGQRVRIVLDKEVM